MPIFAALSRFRFPNAAQRAAWRADGWLLKAAANAGLQVLGVGLALAVNVALARWLGVGVYSEYSYVSSWVMLLAPLSTVGVVDVLQKEMQPLHLANAGSALRSLVQQVATISTAGMLSVVLMSTILVGLLAAFTPTTLTAAGFGAASFAAAAVAIVCYNPAAWMTTAARCMGAVVVSQLGERVVRPLALLAAVGVAYALNAVPSAANANALAAISFAVLLVFSAGIFFSQWRKLPPSPAHPTAAPVRFTLRRRELWAFFALSLAGLLTSRLDGIVLGTLGRLSDVGVYNVAVRFTDLIPFFLQASLTVTVPMYSTLYAASDRRPLQTLISRTSRTVFLATLPLYAALWLGGRWLLALHGAGFAAGFAPMMLLATAQLFYVFCGHNTFLLMMTGYSRTALRVMLVSLVCSTLLAVALVPTFGIWGGVCAKAAGIILWHSWLAVEVWRRLGLIPTAFWRK